MKDNSKLIAIVLAVLALIVIVISLINGNDNNKKNNIKPTIVTNASNFYTVNSCLYRTITYLAAHDRESLELIISEGYKKENNVTKENILEFFFDVEQNSTFVSDKMYYEIITADITKYYVSGHVEINEIMDDIPLEVKNYDSVYFIVYLNSFNNLFSIEPYNGDLFKEGDTDEE